jgi:hypothetical protein
MQHENTVLNHGKRGRPPVKEKRSHALTMMLTERDHQRLAGVARAFGSRPGAFYRDLCLMILPQLESIAELASIAERAKAVAESAVVAELRDVLSDGIKEAEQSKRRISELTSKLSLLALAPVNDDAEGALDIVAKSVSPSTRCLDNQGIEGATRPPYTNRGVRFQENDDFPGK